MHKEYSGANKVIFNLFKTLMRDFFNYKNEFRAKFKETNDKRYELLGDVYKIFANGSYGVFQNIYFRYHDAEIAQFITLTAREQIRNMVTILEEKMSVNVIYGDTDSCFFLADSKEQAQKVVDELNLVIQPFEAKLEHFFLKLFMRGSDDKETKKRYAGIEDTGKVDIKGLEVVRSDWNQFVKDKQKELIELILKEPTTGLYDRVLYFIIDGYNQLRAQAVDPMMLVLSKGIKSDKVYKNKNLPHLRALNQLEDNGSIVRFVSYLKTIEDVLVVEKFEGKDVKSLIDWKYYTINYLNAMLRLLDSIAVEGQEKSKEIIKRLVPKEVKNGKRGRSKKVG
jgi:DNA polymerase elongation subunit (family B)